MAYISPFKEGGGIRPSVPKQGMYPGTGIATGGQQGRMRSMFGGVGGARMGGGFRLGASPRSATKPPEPQEAQGPTGMVGVIDSGFRPPRPGGMAQVNGHGPVTGGKLPKFVWVLKKGPDGRYHRVRVEYSRLTHQQQQNALRNPWNGSPAAQQASGGPSTPDTHAPVTNPDPIALFNGFLDSNYWMGLSQAENQFHEATDADKARLAALSEARPEYGGGTLYDELYRQAQERFIESQRALRSDMSSRGLLRSGAYDRGYASLGSQFANEGRGLMDQYGSNAIRDLQLSIDRQNQSFINEKRQLALKAIADAQARGVQISKESIEAIMSMLSKYGGALPFGGEG